MNKVALAFTALLVTLVAACVTINVYFPEAAAEQAADRIIDKVRGEQTDSGAALSPVEGGLYAEPVTVAAARSYVSFFVPEAKAQANVDFDRPSPEKTARENALANRFPQLRPWYDAGAIGMNEQGNVEVRDRNLIPLKDRNSVLQLVNAQNSDWNALYAEIARINEHPEWENSIRRTFASRWVAKADSGWWYKEDGSWKQK
jgi:uncharacterized protein